MEVISVIVPTSQEEKKIEMLGDVKEAMYLKERQEQRWESQTDVCKVDL